MPLIVTIHTIPIPCLGFLPHLHPLPPHPPAPTTPPSAAGWGWVCAGCAGSRRRCCRCSAPKWGCPRAPGASRRGRDRSVLTWSGWWFQPLWKIWKSSWDDYSQYMENKKCSKPPISIGVPLPQWKVNPFRWKIMLTKNHEHGMDKKNSNVKWGLIIPSRLINHHCPKKM